MKTCNICGILLGSFCKPGSYCPACHATHEHIVDASGGATPAPTTTKKKAK